MKMNLKMNINWEITWKLIEYDLCYHSTTSINLH